MLLFLTGFSLYLIFLLIHSSDFLFYKKSFLKCFFLEKRKYLKILWENFEWNIHEIFEKYSCGCCFSAPIFYVIFIYFFCSKRKEYVYCKRNAEAFCIIWIIFYVRKSHSNEQRRTVLIFILTFCLCLILWT